MFDGKKLQVFGLQNFVNTLGPKSSHELTPCHKKEKTLSFSFYELASLTRNFPPFSSFKWLCLVLLLKDLFKQKALHEVPS